MCKAEEENKKLDFDSEKHIKDMVEAMKKSIEEKDKKDQGNNKDNPNNNQERERESNLPQNNCFSCNKLLGNKDTY
jgi:hypothetical protein